ncbi:MAG: mechanosensitive ion channel [Bacteroidota bacterium]|nr:mechanosensitive ion channel [Bacteroidota bacterium]
MQNIWTYLENAVRLYAVDIAIAIIIVVLGRLVVKMIGGFTGKLMVRKGVDDTLRKFAVSIITALLMAVVFIAALGQLGVETTSLVAIVGAAGLAIGLALQGSLSNFASGVMLIVFRPFRAGDYVEAGGVSGSVQEVSIFTTVLLTPDKKRVIVPNAQITSSPITNYSAEETRRIDFVFGIGYGDDLKKAKEVMTQVVTADDRVLKDPAPTIAVMELADSSVNFVVRPWVKTADYWDVYFDITERMKLRLDEEGISIPFPQRDVHLFQQNN